MGINSKMLLKREAPAWTYRKSQNGQKNMNFKYSNHIIQHNFSASTVTVSAPATLHMAGSQ
jgi:hypothetical protein